MAVQQWSYGPDYPTSVSQGYDWSTYGLGREDPYEIYVTVTDRYDRVTCSDTLNRYVDDTAPNPFALTAPEQDSIVSGTITVSGGTTDPSPGIMDCIIFCRDGLHPIGTVQGGSGSVSFDTTTVADGAHSLGAAGWDVAENYRLSDFVQVQVNNLPPEVELTSPDPNAIFAVGAQVSVHAEASDGCGMDRVEFSYSGPSSGTIGVDDEPSYGVTWDTAGLAGGAYQLTATAYDIGGRSASDTITVYLYSVNLTLDGVSDGEETTVGGYISVNSDDDNTNTTPDKDEWCQVPGEDDLCKLTLDASPATGPAHVILDATEGGQRIKVWTTATKDAQVTLPATYEVTALPKELWVEGYAQSASPKDVTLRLSLEEAECYDEVKVTVCGIALLPPPTALMTGGVNNELHRGALTATIWPVPPSGNMTFSVVGETGKYIPAHLDTSVVAVGNGSANNVLTSSDKLEDVTVRVSFGGASATCTVHQADGTQQEFTISPDSLPSDGAATAEIRLQLVVAGTQTGVEGHAVQFGIGGVLDEFGQEVEDPGLWASYGSVSQAESTTDADGRISGVFHAGYLPGTILVIAEDNNEWIGDEP